MFVPSLAQVTLYKCLINEETKWHLPMPGLPHAKRPPFLFPVWRPHAPLVQRIAGEQAGHHIHIFSGSWRSSSLSHPGLGLALTTLALRKPSNDQSVLNPQTDPCSPQGIGRWPERDQVTSTSHKEPAKVLVHRPPQPPRDLPG